MPYFDSNNCRLYYEKVGQGDAVIFLHEFGGDVRSWQQQMAHFSMKHTAIALACRGYPPSEVPTVEAEYGWQKSLDDVLALIDSLGIEKAHFVGLSMGAFTGLMMCLRHPQRVRSLVAASGGSGAFPTGRSEFIEKCRVLAQAASEREFMPADHLAYGHNRIQLREKNFAEWEKFYIQLGEHPGIGSGLTQKMVQAARPSLHDFDTEFAAVKTPVLLMVGDEDDPCLDTNLWLKRVIPTAGLSVWPKSGHLLNLEDPQRFNAECDVFFNAVAEGHWPDRNELLERHRGPDNATF